MARVRGVKAGKALAEKANKSNKLKLVDGDELLICFAGCLTHGADPTENDKAEPLGTESAWVDTKNGRRKVEFDPNVHEESELKIDYMWNIYIHHEARGVNGDVHPAAGKIKILEKSAGFFNDWIDQKTKKSGFNRWFTIKRKGSGFTDTRYKLIREDEIHPDDVEDISGLQLFDLDKEAYFTETGDDDDKSDDKPRRPRPRSERTPRDNDSGSNGASAGNGVIGADDLAALRLSVKALPDPEGGYSAFKDKFGIDKMKDLPAAQLVAAQLFVQGLSSVSEPQTETAEKDPFE